jgi:hypothetical protein
LDPSHFTRGWPSVISLLFPLPSNF